MFPANAVMSRLFMEDGLTTTGQSMPSKREVSQRSQKIEMAMSTIDQLSGGGKKDKVVTTVLSKSVPALRMYVNGQRETPETELNSLVMQSAILRMKDIAMMTKDMDISDYDATRLLEGIEDDLLKKGHFNSKYIMPHDVQSAINVVIETIVDKHKNSGGSGNLSDIVAELQANSIGNYFDGVPEKTMNGPVYYNDHPDMGWYEPINTDAVDPGSSIGTGLPITQEPLPTTGVLDFVNKAIEVVKDASGAIKTVGSTTGDVLENIKNKAGDIGGDIAAQSLKEAIVKNIPLIIGVVAAIVLTIIFIKYVTKSKG